jgi:hypothetical protein
MTVTVNLVDEEDAKAVDELMTGVMDVVMEKDYGIVLNAMVNTLACFVVSFADDPSAAADEVADHFRKVVAYSMAQQVKQ